MSTRDVVIQIRLPRWSRRRWTAILVALVAVGGAAVWADVTWTQFNQNEKLTSGKLNDNFKAMADAITVLQGQVGPPVYCGLAAFQDGNIGGYAAANKLCQPACGNAATAHVCRSDEVLRLAPAGNLQTPGCYTMGLILSGPQNWNDCTAFTGNQPSSYIPYWTAGPPPQPGGPWPCSNAGKFLCCK